MYIFAKKTPHTVHSTYYLPNCQFGQGLLDPERRRTGVRVLVPALGHEPGEWLKGSRAL